MVFSFRQSQCNHQRPLWDYGGKRRHFKSTHKVSVNYRAEAYRKRTTCARRPPNEAINARYAPAIVQWPRSRTSEWTDEDSTQTVYAYLAETIDQRALNFDHWHWCAKDFPSLALGEITAVEIDKNSIGFHYVSTWYWLCVGDVLCGRYDLNPYQ